MNDTPLPLPTPEAMREFLRAHYRHGRFEGRDPAVWGANYSECMVLCYLDDLRKIGNSVISRHDSISGRPVWFGRRLEAVDGDDFDSYAELMDRLTEA